MPAPCPGDPEYDADGGRPLSQENVEQRREEMRLHRLPLLQQLEEIHRQRASWDQAMLRELDDFGDGPTALDADNEGDDVS